MLVACRLAGLSALERTLCRGQGGRAMRAALLHCGLAPGNQPLRRGARLVLPTFPQAEALAQALLASPNWRRCMLRSSAAAPRAVLRRLGRWALWPNPDQALRLAFSRAKDRLPGAIVSPRWRQPSLARHCSLPVRHAASGLRLASRPHATARTSPLPRSLLHSSGSPAFR